MDKYIYDDDGNCIGHYDWVIHYEEDTWKSVEVIEDFDWNLHEVIPF